MGGDRYTIAYRTDQVQQVIHWIQAGQSGCLIGLRGTGKSNFLRFLLREDVRQQYLGQYHANFVFVLVDLLALTEHTEWAVYEIILDRLASRLDSLGVDKKIIDEIALLHWDVIRSKDSLAGQRAIERCMHILCQQPARRVVLFLDEFNTVFHTLNASFFRCLRSIRDAHKNQISYIVITTDELAYLRNDLIEVEHFYRLVSRNVCGLGPYGETDARQMIRHLASQRHIVVTEGDMICLIELSGGHASLLKAMLGLVWSAQKSSLEELAPTFQDHPVIQAECRKMWSSLSQGEQLALRAVADGQLPDPDVLRRLKLKGLVRDGRSGISIFSPLFSDFACQELPRSQTDTIINRFSQIVRIDGRRIAGLSQLEFEMLCYLYEHRGRVCTKDDLIKSVYCQQYDRTAGGTDDARLHTLIRRLRAKIELDPSRPRYIITVRGEGYRFVETEGQRA